MALPRSGFSSQNDWRWVVFAASFVSSVANSPIYLAFGTFVLPWKNEFSASGATIALITSCGSSVCAFGCPFGSYIIERWGYRKTHVIGGVLLMISFATSSFANSLLHLFLTYSIVGGTGSALCMVSYINAISEYFHDHQGIAFSVVTSAYGIGGFLFPLLFQALIYEYTWRGAMFVTSALMGNVIACGLLLYPFSRSPRSPDLCCCNTRRTRSNEVIKMQKILKKRSDQHLYSSESEYDKDADTHSMVNSGAFCNGEMETKYKQKTRDAHSSTKTLQKRKQDPEDAQPSENAPQPRQLSFCEITVILLQSGTFYIMIIHNITTYMGFFMIFGLTPIRAHYDTGLSMDQVAALVSALGISQLVFRIFYGVVVEFKWMKISTIYISGHVLSGGLALLSLLANTYLLQFIYCIAASAAFSALGFYMVLVFQIYDRQLFNVAFGYLEMAHGIGVISGPWIGGALFDYTDACQYSFIFAGVAILFGISVLLIGVVSLKQTKKLDF